MPDRKKCVNWVCGLGLAIGLIYVGVLIERHVLHDAKSDESGGKPAAARELAERPTPIESAVPKSAPESPSGAPPDLARYVDQFAAFLERFPGGEVRMSPSGNISFDPTPYDLSPGPDSPPFITRGSEDYPLVDASFVLTPQAIRELSLDEEEAIAVQAALNKLQGDYREKFAAIAKPDPLRTDEAAGIYAFCLPSFVAESEAMLGGFGAEVSEHIGEGRSERLLEIFNMPDHFASFGTKDVFVKFRDTKVGGQQVMRAEWGMHDPATGKVRQGVQASMETFEREFGKIFSVDEVQSTGAAP